MASPTSRLQGAYRLPEDYVASDGRAWPLLACGVILAPLFHLVVVAQLLTREGFDIARHPLSLLSLGENGWIQTANFLVTGLLALACAFGLRMRLRGGTAGTWGPILVATYGIGMVIAGLFPADPLLGFPPGTPEVIPETISSTAKVHGFGFFLAFGSLTAACFVFARRFLRDGRPGWRRYSRATGAVLMPIVFAGMAIPSATSVIFFLVGIIGFGWLSALAWYFAARSVPPVPNRGRS